MMQTINLDSATFGGFFLHLVFRYGMSVKQVLIPHSRFNGKWGLPTGKKHKE